MKILRTPDESFEGITDFPYQPNFTNIETLKINSNNTTLHVGSNVLGLGNNTGETSQVNS